MELKVWVDGIQRVVCGVTEASTCQDVVYALAHATGQTGRFTLVEKWRNSERLLAPQEQPLKVLTKWGEYANDVHFVMRRSSGDPKVSSGNNQSQNNNKRQHDFLRGFSPSGSNKQKIPLNNKEIKKSLTFSCGHGSSGSVSSENSTPPIINECSQPNCETSTNRNIKNREGRSKQDLPKGVVRGVPQRPRDSESPSSKIERPKYPPSYDEAVSRSSGRFPTSHLSLANSSSSASSHVVPDEESPSSKRPHLANRADQYSPMDRGPSSSSQPQNNHLRQPNSHNKSHLITDQIRDFHARSPDPPSISSSERLSPSRAKSPSRSPEKPTQLSSYNNISDDSMKLKKTLSAKLEIDKHLTSENKTLSPKSCQPEDLSRDPQYQDLLRLVSLQREKLDNQQAELSQFDAEILYWEGRLQEQEEKLSVLQEEVCHLERTHHEQEGELIQLDRRSFSEEVELGRQEERTLRSELTLARSQLANCETELLQCRQRIRLLLEEIAEEKRVKSLREEQERKEQEEQERQLQTQVECLQQQLKEKMTEADSQAASEEAKEELQDLDVKLSEKQKEIEVLMADIREANLRSLSLIPSEEGKLVLEGNFYNRPGSTRKIIGSPRQLENAVPTNKNPHGVWV